jgi:hypothetical protein
MNLYIYFLVYSFSCILAIYPKTINQKIFPYFWFLVAMGVSVGLRENIGGDIPNYIKNIPILGNINLLYDTIDERGLNILGLKEPLFWVVAFYVYDFFQNPFASLYFFDAVSFIFLYNGIRLILKSDICKIYNSDANFLYLNLLLYYPIAHGLASSYRQAIASTIIICALGFLLNKRLLWSLFYFLCATLIHNPAIMFLPLIMLSLKNAKFGGFLTVLPIIAGISVVVIFFDVPVKFLIRGAGPTEVGGSLIILNSLILGLITAFCFALNITFDSNNLSKVYHYQYYAFGLYLFSYIFLSTGDMQRIFQYLLAVMIVFYYSIFYHYLRNNIWQRLLFLNSSLLAPMLLMGSIIK